MAHINPSASVDTMPICDLTEVDTFDEAVDAYVVMVHHGQLERMPMTTLAKMVKKLNKGPKV